MAETESDAAAERGDGDVPRIVHTEGVLGGDPRIAGTRVGVAHVYRRHVEGDEAPASIADGLDVSLAAVHAALAYGFAHTREMQAIAERNAAVRDDRSDRLVPDDR